ncbi:unnamed protein product [Prunus armeniaca]
MTLMRIIGEDFVVFSVRPPHPYSRYLSQVYLVPKVDEVPDYDDEDWLFGCNGNQSKKLKVESSGVAEIPEVWLEALRIESTDVLPEKWIVFSSGEGEDLRQDKHAEEKVGEAIVKLRTPVWCRAKALQCLSQLRIVTLAEEVKVGGLCRISMWDFAQVAVVVTRVLEIKFGSRELRQVSGTLDECLPSAREKACLP